MQSHHAQTLMQLQVTLQWLFSTINPHTSRTATETSESQAKYNGKEKLRAEITQ